MTNRIPSDAFERYCAMDRRSYRVLAEQLGVSTRAITKCAARENWTERLSAIEQEARERSDEKLTESMEEMRTRHLRTLRAVHGRAVAALRSYPLTSASEAVRAIDVAVRLERLVAGDPAERTELTVRETTRGEIERLLARDDEPEEGDEGGDDDDDDEERGGGGGP